MMTMMMGADPAARQGAAETESDLGWMFEVSREELQLPDVPLVPGKRARRQSAHTRRPVAVGLTLAIAAAMLCHELAQKSLANALLLVVLAIYVVTGLWTAIRHCGDRVAPPVALSLFVAGFGPGFLLLVALEALLGAVLLGAYCVGTDCSALAGESYLRAVPEVILASPLRGVAFAFLLSFGNAAFLEESIKLVFVSNAVAHVPLGLGGDEVQRRRGDALECGDADHGSDSRVCDDMTLEVTYAGGVPRAVTGHVGIIMYFIAFSLGLALSESMLYVCCFARSPSEAMRVVWLRMLVSIPMHCACGCLTGLGLCERYLGNGQSLRGVLLPGVLLHGAFDFMHVVVPMVSRAGLDEYVPLETLKHALSLAVLACTIWVLRSRLAPLRSKLALC